LIFDFFYKVVSKYFEERSKVFQNDYTLLLSHQPMSNHIAIATTLGNNFPHFHVQFGAGMLLCEVGQQYGVIPHIGISSCLVVRGVFPQTRYVLG